jgi:hypothetical protein
MAQDKNGVELAVGDKVLVECEVTFAGPRPVGQLTVQPPEYTAGVPNVTFSLHSNQVVKGTL